MRQLIIALAFATLSIAAGAQAAPASQASVEDLLALTKTEAMLDSMYAGVEQMTRKSMEQAVQGKTVTPEQQRVLDGMPAKFIAVMRQEMSWAKMKPQYVQLYRETFSQDEIDGLTTFYKSPTGQAFVTKMPVVMQKSMVIAQSQMQTLMPKMKAAMDEAIAEAKITK